MASSALYAQHQLQRGQIRLLKRTSTTKDDLQFTFTTIQLERESGSQAPSRPIDRYFALSYTWGTDAASHEITIDGHAFLVRDNLLLFLQQWCTSDAWAREVFWIDAVCIDQLNTAEKNVQVGMMGRVYDEASMVIAWLGSGTEHTSRAMAVLNTDLDNASTTTEEQRERALIAAKEDVRHLLERRYWTRRWILQEFLPAGLKECLILACGPDSTLLRRPTIAAMQDVYFDLERDTPALNVFKCLSWDPSRAYVPHAQRLFTICESASHMDATEPRDTVYAILSLMALDVGIEEEGNAGGPEQPSWGKLEVDYDIPIPKLFIQVAVSLVRHMSAMPHNMKAALGGGYFALALNSLADGLKIRRRDEAIVSDLMKIESIYYDGHVLGGLTPPDSYSKSNATKPWRVWPD